MLTRRTLMRTLAQLGIAAGLPGFLLRSAYADEAVTVNDAQSRLNATPVREVVRPRTVEELRAALRRARAAGRPVSVAGGRHAMGGQQFLRDGIHIDSTALSAVRALDKERGLVEVEAGIQWPELITHLNRVQQDDAAPWAIREKQTGIDEVTIGGSLASNVHGRGLTFPPFAADIESLTLLGPDGELRTCSRKENADLFARAIGGYGLFGIAAHVTLRLARRTKVERVVEIIRIKDLIPAVQKRIDDGYLYGDCQYSTDLSSPPEEHPGVFSCYRPVPDETPIPTAIKQLSGQQWADFYRLARTDKQAAFQRYADYYLSTNGQVYYSDTHQITGSFQDYRQAVDASKGTEVITEVYVTHENFLDFMARMREDFQEHRMDMTYGTIRFIEQDRDTYLPWATERSVCIVCNLHVPHTPEGLEKAAKDFRRIIDRALEFGGRYYLTYHRHATRDQLLAAYPNFPEFLREKQKHDPTELFQSDWYRHHKEMLADLL